MERGAWFLYQDASSRKKNGKTWLSEGEAGTKQHPLCDGKKAVSPCKQHRRTGGMRFLKASPWDFFEDEYILGDFCSA